MGKVNEKDIIYVLRDWKLEVESGHNDGWTRYHYLEKILKVKKYVDESFAKYGKNKKA